MDPNKEGKNLEIRLKKAAVGIAIYQTPPTGFEPPEPPSKDSEFRSITRLAVVIMSLIILTTCYQYLISRSIEESLEDKVRRVRQEGSVYRYDDDMDDKGKERFNNHFKSKSFLDSD